MESRSKNKKRIWPSWQIAIQEESYQQISSELHDNACQTILLSILNLQRIDKDNPELKISDTIELLEETLHEIHQLSRSLNGELILSIGLRAALEKQLERLRNACGIQTSLSIKGKQQYLCDEMELIIYRIIQEALNNVLKHAKASKVEVELNFLEQELNIKVMDNGKGFDQTTDHFTSAGLRNMNFRAASLHGKLKIESTPNLGSCLTLQIPCLKTNL
jgi:signal transduction histidine kinase